MTRTAGRRPKIDAALLPTWWAAGVRITDIAAHFRVCPMAVRRAAHGLGLAPRQPWGPTITLTEYRAQRRAAIADLMLAQIERAAAETRGAMACAEMVDQVGRNSLTGWQRGMM